MKKTTPEKPAEEPAEKNPPPSPTITETTTVKEVTAEELTTPLGTHMPPVTENSTAMTEGSGTPPAPATPPPPSPANPAKKAPRDSKGNIFNPARHRVNADGSPYTTKSGLFALSEEYRKKHAGELAPEKPPGERPPPTFSKPGDPEPAPTGEAVPVGKIADQYDAAAELYLLSAYGPVIIGFSEHAKPNEEEHAAIKVALANYLRSKQITEPSPGWALLFVVTAVAVKKAEHPEVKKRGKTLWQKITGKFRPPQIPPPTPETETK